MQHYFFHINLFGNFQGRQRKFLSQRFCSNIYFLYQLVTFRVVAQKEKNEETVRSSRFKVQDPNFGIRPPHEVQKRGCGVCTYGPGEAHHTPPHTKCTKCSQNSSLWPLSRTIWVWLQGITSTVPTFNTHNTDHVAWNHKSSHCRAHAWARETPQM